MRIKYMLNLLLLAAGMAFAEPAYELVWADEFNTDGPPNPDNWTYEHGHVRNQEAQWYQPDNATCTNGLLVIEGRRERVPNTNHVPGSKDWKTQWKFANYTSSCLITKGLHSWQYGRFELRAKLDVRPGLWPAFWTLGVDGRWPDNGEIDIMEYYKETLLANAFWGSKKPFKPLKKTAKVPLADLGDSDWADQFHVWRMDWDEESIKLYVDDQLLNEIQTDRTVNQGKTSIKNPFRQPHYLLLNLAIGGGPGGDPSSTEFPARFEVDYVRVYQQKPAAELVFEEDWSSGVIDPDKWYRLHRRWGQGNHGVVTQNVYLAQDRVEGVQRNVLICRGHGDQYDGPVVGWNGHPSRVGGVIVTKPFFASGKYEVVMKIGSTERSPDGPQNPVRPVGMVPAIWTYAYRWVGAKGADPKVFHRSNPLYNPYLKNEYWSEIDFPEFGKNQELETGLYNAFLNKTHQSRTFSTEAAIAGRYHTFTTIWRTHLVPMPDVSDDQVVESEGYWWVQDKAVPFSTYRGSPLEGVEHFCRLRQNLAVQRPRRCPRHPHQRYQPHHGRPRQPSASLI